MARVAVVVAVFLTLVAHLRLLPEGLRYSGPLRPLAAAFELGVAGAQLGLAIALGDLALRRWGPTLAAVERLVFTTTIGLAALSLALFLASLLLGPHPAVVALVLLGLFLAARRALPEVLPLLREAAAELRTDGSRPILFVLGALGVALVLQGLSPPTDWDSLMYHLRVPRQFLEVGRFFYPGDNPHAAFVGAPHALYLVPLAVGSLAAPALLNGACALLLALAVFAFGRRFGSPRLGSAAAIGLWGATMLLLVAFTARVDAVFALFLFCAHYALLAAEGEGRGRFLALAAIAAGFALGAKYHAALYLLALLPLWLWRMHIPGQGARPYLRQMAMAAGLGLAFAIPLYLKNALVFGNPIYPFGGGPSLVPWLGLLGLPAPEARQGLESFELLTAATTPFSLGAWIRDPASLTLESEGLLYGPNPLWLLAPMILLVLRERWVALLLFPALAYAALLLAVEPATNLRYLLPVAAPLTLATLRGVEWTMERLRRGGRADALLTALGLASLTAPLVATLLIFGGGAQLGYLGGVLDGYEYLDRRSPQQAEMLRATRELTDPGSTLLLFEARGLHFQNPVIQDNLELNWPALRPLAVEGRCPDLGPIRSLLLNRVAAEWLVARGAGEAAVGLTEFDAYARRCLRAAARTDTFELYEVP